MKKKLLVMLAIMSAAAGLLFFQETQVKAEGGDKPQITLSSRYGDVVAAPGRKEGPSASAAHSWQGRTYANPETKVTFSVPENLYIGNNDEWYKMTFWADVWGALRDSEDIDLVNPDFLVFTRTGSYVSLAYNWDQKPDDWGQNGLVGATPESSKQKFESTFSNRGYFFPNFSQPQRNEARTIEGFEDKTVVVAGSEFSGYAVRFKIGEKSYEKNNLFCRKDGKVFFLSYLLKNGSDKELTDFIQSWASIS